MSNLFVRVTAQCVDHSGEKRPIQIDSYINSTSREHIGDWARLGSWGTYSHSFWNVQPFLIRREGVYYGPNEEGKPRIGQTNFLSNKCDKGERFTISDWSNSEHYYRISTVAVLGKGEM